MNNQIISGKTRVCGIMGDPVEHTVSPAMHNAAFRESGLDYIYVPFHVPQERVEEAVKGLRALNIRGMNVTIPHKVAVIPYLDEVDETARYIGAVNTIVNENGFLKGCNTDASGFLRALAAEKIDPVGKSIVIIGAGGAARAISVVLADKAARLTLLNRHPDSARVLAGRLTGLFRKEVKACDLQRESLAAALDVAHLLINTTSVGMSPDSAETPVPAGLIRPGMAVIDIIYNPVRTRLLVEAERQGAVTVSGMEMLVRQGAEAFELWTGHKAPVDVMREAGIRALG